MLTDNWVQKDLKQLLTLAGRWEAQSEISTLFSAGVTAYNSDPTRAALYFGKPDVPIPLDYYIRPQFLSELDDYRQSLVDLFTLFANNTHVALSKDRVAKIEKEVEKVVQFQVQLAMNFVPNDLLRASVP